MPSQWGTLRGGRGCAPSRWGMLRGGRGRLPMAFWILGPVFIFDFLNYPYRSNNVDSDFLTSSSGVYSYATLAFPISPGKSSCSSKTGTNSMTVPFWAKHMPALLKTKQPRRLEPAGPQAPDEQLGQGDMSNGGADWGRAWDSFCSSHLSQQ